MNADLARLKASVDLVAVAQSRGVKLTKQGRDYVGLCPFHREKTPSFHITPSKNLFHCLGCDAGGSVIDFIMRLDGLDKSQAVAWLKEKTGSVFKRKPAPISAPEKPLQPQDASALLQRVVAFYSKTFRKDRKGQDYLTGRKLSDAAMFDVFQVGYSNGTLHKALPKSGEMIQGLKTLGVLNARNQEHFHGFVTVPIFNEAGVVGIYGRNIQPCEPDSGTAICRGRIAACSTASPPRTSQTLFLTESIFDAMALWQAGFKNVIALYGTGGWTADHERAFARARHDRGLSVPEQRRGRRGACTQRLKEKLSSLVKQIHVVQWPEGVKDAADFFLSRPPADFEALVKTANPGTPAPQSEVTARQGDEKIEMTADGFVASYGSRRYEVRAVEHPNPARLKATVKAVSSDPANAGRFHIDTVDFYLSRSRRTFISEAARLFRDTVEVIEGDVNRLIGQVETYAQEQRDKAARPGDACLRHGPSRGVETRPSSRSGGRNPPRPGTLRPRGRVDQQNHWLRGHDQPEDARPAVACSRSPAAGRANPLAGRLLSLCPTRTCSS